MKTLVLASQKGGVGKTTLAAHLAVAAEKAGNGPCVLIDTDPQASLAAWWNGRKADTPAFAPVTPQELTRKLEALSQAGYAYAFIDTPPAITESIRAWVAQADFVLIVKLYYSDAPTLSGAYPIEPVGALAAQIETFAR